MRDPLVSVVVSTYRGERLLRGCLEMLLRQSISDRLEIIVIDSGSPENERGIVQDMQKEHPNIVYERTPRETLYSAWNRALRLSTGIYFANVNTDDWIREDALELFAKALDREPHADVAFAHWASTDTAQRAPTEGDLVNFHAPYHPALPLFYCYSGSTQFWRTSTLSQLGGFDDSFSACGDAEALYRLMRAGGNAVLVPHVLEGLFQNPKGISLGSDVALREVAEITARARRETPLTALFAIDPEDALAVAAGWTALGNMAMQLRIPWLDDRLNDRSFAHECYRRALTAAPNYPPALHNRYSVYFEAGEFGPAESCLAALPPTTAARIRGADLGLVQPHVEPARQGPVYEHSSGVGPVPNSILSGTRPRRIDAIAAELAGAKEYIASLEWHLAREKDEAAKLREALTEVRGTNRS
ncbi:MAG: glycosyltransferase [Actinomycetota bacterium]|nr:glycosyltransferase [Actinomycetota bacterium]